MVTFIGGYIAGMAVALLAVMFFTGVKRGNAACDGHMDVGDGRLAAAAVRREGVDRSPDPRVRRELAARAAARREPVEF